jgi:exocyst complex protein 7
MEPPEDKRTLLDSVEEVILRWDSTVSEEARERMIFESNRDEVDCYLQAIDEIQ